jgi:hypothetical protein
LKPSAKVWAESLPNQVARLLFRGPSIRRHEVAERNVFGVLV